MDSLPQHGDNAPQPRALPITAPRLPANLVARPRLLTALDSPAPLIVVHGPAGFGKTTLIVQWLEHASGGEEDLIWVPVRNRVGSADDTWRLLAEELSFSDFPVPQRPPQEAVQTVLRTLSRPTMIVLDGLPGRLGEGVEHPLLDILRQNRLVRVMVSMRQGLALVPARVPDTDVVVVGPEDLQFTAEESDHLLRRLVPDSTGEQRAFVHEEFGGWPSLIRTAGLDGLNLDRAKASLRPRRFQSLESEGGTQFVLRTAIVDSFTLEQARVLTADPRAEERLRYLIESGAVRPVGAVTPPGDSPFQAAPPGSGRAEPEARYAYLPAVRTAIRGLSGEAEMAVMRAAHARVADWDLLHGSPLSALEHAFTAHDWDLAVTIIEDHWNEVLASGMITDLVRRVDPDVIEGHPALKILQDVLIGQKGATAVRVPALESHPLMMSGSVASVDGSIGTVQIDEGLTLREVLDSRAGQAVSLRFHGNFKASGLLVEAMQDALTRAAPHERAAVFAFLPTMHLQWALTQLLNDDPVAAAANFSQAYDLAREQDIAFLIRNAAGGLALVFALNGDRENARLWLAREDEAPPDESVFHDVVRTFGLAARALLAVDALDLVGARGFVEQMSPAAGKDEMWAFIAFTSAAVGLVDGRAREQLQALTAARIAHPTQAPPGSTADLLLRAVTADLLMSEGEASHAAAVVKDGPAEHPLLKTARARLALLAGNLDTVMLELAGGVEIGGYARTHGERQLLRAVAQLRLGDRLSAGETFRDVHDHLVAVGSIRPFRTIDPADLAELASLAGRGADVVSNLEGADRLFPREAEVVTLSEREHIVLAQLDRDLTHAEIAAELVVSPNTVKTQVRSVYRKLGASCREEALAIARRLGILGAGT